MELNEAIAKAKKNNQAAFKFLLDYYWNDVYGFQLKRTNNESDAEDITIEAFSKAFDKLDSYKPEYNFKTWLITISKNLHTDLVRKEKIRFFQNNNVSNVDDFHQIADESPSPEDNIITEQNLAKLLRDIKKLKPAYQEVIQLRYFQEMSYKDISNQLAEPINNIKVKLLRAKKLLAEIITKQ